MPILGLSRNPWLTVGIALLPVVTVVLIVVLKLEMPKGYGRLIAEDGLVENCTVLVYFISSVIALLLARSLLSQRHSVFSGLYLALALALAVIALEELNWGQRILELETPGFFIEHATKPELSLHNLKAFPLGYAFILVGFYGAFSRLILRGAIESRFALALDMLTPRLMLSGYFLVPFLLYSYYEYAFHAVIKPLGLLQRRDYDWSGHFITGKDQEPIELLLALGFLLFLIDNWSRYALISTTSRAPVSPLKG